MLRRGSRTRDRQNDRGDDRTLNSASQEEACPLTLSPVRGLAFVTVPLLRPLTSSRFWHRLCENVKLDLSDSTYMAKPTPNKFIFGIAPVVSVEIRS